MLTQDIAEIKDGRIITKDGRTVDQIYKGFQLYKSGKAPAEFTAIKEKDQYQGSLDDVKRQIDKYWEKKDAEELAKKTGDAMSMGADLEERRKQKEFLRQKYPDYDPKRHDVFVMRYNEEEQKKAEEQYRKNRGIDSSKSLLPEYYVYYMDNDGRKVIVARGLSYMNAVRYAQNHSKEYGTSLEFEVQDQKTRDATQNIHSPMYQRGLQNAIRFAYIPDFKNEQEKKDFEAGLKAGYEENKKFAAKSKNEDSTFDALDPDEAFDSRDIEKETIANNYFRKVLFTSERLQLVLMSLKPGEEIGEEVHPTTDQFFRIEEGKGKAVIDGKEILIKDGSSILIKSGRVHNIINDSEKPLKLYSLYSPPQHQDGLIQKEK